MTAVIALCKCSQTKNLYGIRFEKDGKAWKYTWAFPVKEATASREQYDKTRITGGLIQSPDYPGCPYCGTNGFFHCGCGKLNCWDGKSHHATCNWCGASGELTDGIDSIDITGNF
ncbi:MAG: TerY-C metal binding domain-containing protein [Parabacteroides sp.]|nr:TerY-C metal binding domain-containing protein [Parabacteroides sp.]